MLVQAMFLKYDTKTTNEEKIDKLGFIKILKKDTIKEVKKLATEGEKIFANHLSGQDVVSRIYKY